MLDLGTLFTWDWADKPDSQQGCKRDGTLEGGMMKGLESC